MALAQEKTKKKIFKTRTARDTERKETERDRQTDRQTDEERKTSIESLGKSARSSLYAESYAESPLNVLKFINLRVLASYSFRRIWRLIASLIYNLVLELTTRWLTFDSFSSDFGFLFSLRDQTRLD